MESKVFLAVPWIVFLPAIGCLVIGLFGRKLGDRLSGFIATAASFGAFGVALYAGWFLVREQNPEVVYVYKLYRFLETGFINLDMAFHFDRLAALVAVVATGVASFVHLHASGYLRGRSNPSRFFFHLGMLLFFVLFLALGKSLLLMFMGWVGVGMCAYFLLGFRREEDSEPHAGMSTFLIGRICDAVFLVGLFLLLMYNHGSLGFGSLEAWSLSGAAPVENRVTITAICLLLFFGTAGRLVQVPFYTWLPDESAALTPAAAWASGAMTLVAGAYMLYRLWFLFSLVPVAIAAAAGVAVLMVLVAVAARLLGLKVAGRYFVYPLRELVVVRLWAAAANFCSRVVDGVFIDLLAVRGSAFAVKAVGVLPRIYHNGNVQRYLFAVVLGLVCLWIVL